MDDHKTFEEAAKVALIAATASPKPVIVSLPNMDNLPDRLDDAMMGALQTFALSPTPEPFPSSPAHFTQCLRILIANMPRKASDELDGELVVATYQRMLGHASDAAISYMTEQALRQKWFPTIAECLGILGTWECPPDADRTKALSLVRREQSTRADIRQREDMAAMESAFATLADLDWLELNALPQNWLRIAFERGLVEGDAWHRGFPAYKLTGTAGQWQASTTGASG